MSQITLRRHRLRHLAELKVAPELLTARFDSACATTRCSGRCCATGVWADAAERDAIVRHADTVRRHMDDGQTRDLAQWFDAEPWDHPDFPSGRAIGTAATDHGCVFLRADRRCVLQVASNEETGPLKPFFCYAFPVTLSEATLSLDEPRENACCTPSPGGAVSVLEMCAEELRYVLGPDGVDEIRNQVRGEES